MAAAISTVTASACVACLAAWLLLAPGGVRRLGRRARPGRGTVSVSPLRDRPEGTVVPLGNKPEGLVFDPATRLLAVGLTDPDGLALVDAHSGRW